MASMRVFKTAEERVRGEIARLEATREKLFHSREQATAEVRSLEARQPDIELDRLLVSIEASEVKGVSVSTDNEAVAACDDLHGRIQRAQAAIAGADQAEKALMPRLERALTELRELEAQVIDRQVNKLGKELAEHTSKVSALLAQLAELEGATYMSAASHVRQIVGVASHGGKGKTMPPDLGPVTIPRSEVLATQIAELRDQAMALRRREFRSHGRISGYSLDELLTQMRVPGVIAPSESEVRAWFDTASDKAAELWRKAHGQFVPVTKTRTAYVLGWRNGRVDTASSSATFERIFELRTGPLREREPEGPVYSH